MKRTSPLLSVVLLALPTVASAQGLHNGDFSSGLEGWQTREDGGGAGAGSVVPVDGAAELREGDSFLVSLEQTFVVPPTLQSLSFTVEPIPGFDGSDPFLPDAFEASLLDAEGRVLAAPWDAAGSAFVSLQESGAALLGATTAASDARYTVDASGLSVGSEVTLAFHLVGGDADTGSAVRVSGVGLVLANQPPTANAGGDATICLPASAVLDGSASTDPESAPLAYEWRDESGAVVGSAASVPLSLPEGEHDFTLTVEDDVGHRASDVVAVTVRAACADAGSQAGDAGAGDPDGGAQTDGGARTDGGGQTGDAGAPADDAGTTPNDAGQTGDAGAPADDAGTTPDDAGSIDPGGNGNPGLVDGGAPDAGKGGVSVAECSCRQGPLVTDRAPPFIGWLAIALLLWPLRRRR